MLFVIGNYSDKDCNKVLLLPKEMMNRFEIREIQYSNRTIIVSK